MTRSRAPRRRKVWAAAIWPREIPEVLGALRVSRQLHWTRQAACEEAEEWCRLAQTGPVNWEIVDDWIVIGRLSNEQTAVVRGLLLPEPPAAAARAVAET
jgi:hypothetical protein